jgi:regulator of sigma E protease
MKLLLVILAFNLMILIHELGHFLMAKLFRVKVLEFSLFVGKKIWSRQYGDTVYSLRTIPIAAYVKMEGEEEHAEGMTSYSSKPIWQRVLIILGGPLANILSAVLAIAIVFSVRDVDITKIAHVEDESPAAISGLQVGDRVLSYNGKRTHTPSDFFMYAYFNKEEPVYLDIERNKERKSLVFAPQTNRRVYLMGAVFHTQKGTFVEEVTPGSPAMNEGILPGDEILTMNGQRVLDFAQIKDVIQSSEGNPIIIELMRGDDEIRLALTPRVHTEEMYLGLVFQRQKLSFFPAIRHAGIFVYSNVRNVGYTLNLLTSRKAKVTDMSGPLGIVAVMNSVVNRSVGFGDLALDLLDIFAIISIAIGATNLIPFPPLDGSKLVFLGIESVFKKPIPIKIEAGISMVGMTLLMLLALFVTYGDITKIFTGFFSK